MLAAMLADYGFSTITFGFLRIIGGYDIRLPVGLGLARPIPRAGDSPIGGMGGCARTSCTGVVRGVARKLCRESHGELRAKFGSCAGVARPIMAARSLSRRDDRGVLSFRRLRHSPASAP